MNGSPGAPAVYELTVVGALGPVLRTALEPCRSIDAQQETIVRVRGREDLDLVDLVQVLREHGLEVENLTALD